MASSSFFEHSVVLITGGAGFIGSNLAIRLHELGASVRVLDNFLPGGGANAFNLDGTPVELIRGDLRDAAVVEAAVQGTHFIFNLAGHLSHADSMIDPYTDLEMNVRSHVTLLEVCKKISYSGPIVHTSTRQIYGVPQYIPVDERHPICPVDVNGINKYAGEEFHTLYAKVHGLKTVSLRLTNTFGPRQHIATAKQGVVGWFVYCALEGREIQLFGGGLQQRDFNHVDDVVEALVLAASTPGIDGQVFNLGGECTDLKTIASTIIEAAGSGTMKEVVFPQERKLIDIGQKYSSSYEKFKAATGWAPRAPLLRSLADMTRYYLKHKNHYLHLHLQ